MRGDVRGVSLALTHALTIAITAVLVSSLLIASGTLLESQEQRVSEEQIAEIGSDAASYVYNFDRLNATGDQVSATVTPAYPPRVVDSYTYRVELREAGGEAVLEIKVDRLGLSTSFGIDTETPIDPASESSGDGEIEINLCPDPQEITLGGCD
jgi:hypothetical protein